MNYEGLFIALMQYWLNCNELVNDTKSLAFILSYNPSINWSVSSIRAQLVIYFVRRWVAQVLKQFPNFLDSIKEDNSNFFLAPSIDEVLNAYYTEDLAFFKKQKPLKIKENIEEE